jgi:hypothetical protein
MKMDNKTERTRIRKSVKTLAGIARETEQRATAIEMKRVKMKREEEEEAAALRPHST